MTYIKNIRPIYAFEEFISPIKMQNQTTLDLYHHYILKSNVYIFLYKKKRNLKSTK